MSTIEKSVQEIRTALLDGTTTARALTEAYLSQIESQQPTCFAFITYDAEDALRQADAIDAKIKKGETLGALAGVTVALKDNMCTTNMPTTCASRMLENFVSPYEATVVQRLKAADAIIIGKTNLDEFAMGNTTETSYFGVTRNPRHPEHVPGGSSGGSAAAVAANMTCVALGSDTGGSIRQPAAYCGVYGLKPTYGSVSRYGCVAFASSLDQIGPMANSVEDLAAVMNVIAGFDDNDSTSADIDYPDYSANIGKDIKGLKIGVPEEYLQDGIDEAVRRQILQAMTDLKALGAEVEMCSLPTSTYALPAYYLISPAEASSNLARFDGVRFGFRVEGDDMIDMFKKTRSQGFGEEVKRRIMFGTYVLSAGYYDAFYLKALKVRRLIKDDFKRALQTYDCLLTPTTVTTAPKIGMEMDVVAMYQQDLCTVTSNLTGLPAISVPYGRDAQGLPIGLQLIAEAFAEPKLLQVAAALTSGREEAE